MVDHYRIVGGLGSPYSMKMRAVFRYRRLQHVFEMRNGKVSEEVAHVRPSIVPMVRGADDRDWMVDSTPIIYELESRHSSDRSILPDSAGDRFLAGPEPGLSRIGSAARLCFSPLTGAES